MNLPILSHKLVVLFLIVALIGFTDAAYLTYAHYTHTIPPCSLVEGCETVTTSVYATVGRVPIALGGALYYLLLSIMAVAYLDTKRAFLMRIAGYLTAAGFLASALLVGLQVFVIKAFCLYCLASAATSTLLFFLGIIILKKLRVRAETYDG
jgi:uncharacterized membrane protein